MSFPGVLSKNPLKYFWPIQILTPAARTAGGNGASIDRYRNGGYAALTLMLNPGVWTDGTHSFVIQESPDNATWTTVVAADLLPGPEVGVYGTAATFVNITAVTAVVQRIDYIGRMRYVRVQNAASGTTTGAVFGVQGLLFAPTTYPAA